MDRPKRIRLVTAIGIGIGFLVVAFFGAPLIAWIIWPVNTGDIGDADAMLSSFSQASRTAYIANTVSMISLAIAGLAFLYAIIEVAIWFIGPNGSSQTSTD